mgnify:CR=1 FL=1
MQQLRSLFAAGRQPRPPRNGIDLGGGHFVKPEDVLEGHFRRLAVSSAPAASTASHEVQVQVGGNLKAAIRVMAPTLAPLTQIAEELAGKFTTVSPTPQFRSELHRALEAAHRQQIAQRSLGTQTAPPVQTAPSWLWYLLAGSFVATATLVLILARRKR